MDDREQQIEPAHAPSRWSAAQWGLVGVILSLTLAILLPWLAERRVERLRDEINDFADPARLRVAQIQLELALEGAERRGYLLARDEALEKEFLLSRGRRRR